MPPKGRVRTATAAEARALTAHESALKAADRADGGNRYRTFRRAEDAAFREALAEDRRNLPWWRRG